MRRACRHRLRFVRRPPHSSSPALGLILFELLLTRLFGVVLFAQFAHLALALALLGIGIGAVLQHVAPSLVPDEGSRIASAGSSPRRNRDARGRRLRVVVPAGRAERGAAGRLRRAVFDQGSAPRLAWFAVLLPIIALPFVAGGLAFAGCSNAAERTSDSSTGPISSAGCGSGAVPPALERSPAPPGLRRRGRHLRGRGSPLVPIEAESRRRRGHRVLRRAARDPQRARHEVLARALRRGLREEQVVYSKWTPLARLSISEQGSNGTYLLLDNSSASEIFLDRLASSARPSGEPSLVWHS